MVLGSLYEVPNNFFFLLNIEIRRIYQIESIYSVCTTYKHVAQQIHALPLETI